SRRRRRSSSGASYLGLGVVVRDEIETDAVLEIRLAARQEETEPAHRVEGFRDLLVIGAGEPGDRDAHERRAIGTRSEGPLDRGRPLDQDPPVLLDGFHRDPGRYAVHVPVPDDLLALLQPGAAPREPELARD